MRVVSLVPSWTETLIEAGAHLVGRTRFCIHPSSEVSAVVAVGGTKSFDFDLVHSLAPDLIIMDREENTLEMFEQASRLGCAIVVTHVKSVSDLAREFGVLAAAFAGGDAAVNDRLNSFADRAVKSIAAPGTPPLADQFVYCIWKDPWMAVGTDTFIASMLAREGIVNLWPSGGHEKYPKFELADVPSETVMLLSSEPYPFAKKNVDLGGHISRLVDGERYSWFGIRALRHLESLGGLRVDEQPNRK